MSRASDLAAAVVDRISSDVAAMLQEFGVEAPTAHNHPVKPNFKPTPYRYQQGCRHPDCERANRLYYHQWRQDHKA